MRLKTLSLLLLLALTTACTSRYSDGWQPDRIDDPAPASKPDEPVKPTAKPEAKPEVKPEVKPDVKPEQPQDVLFSLNDQFRSAYKAAREEALKNETYALVLGDSVVFYRGAIRREVQYTPVRYHELKAVAHIPLTLFVMLNAGVDENTIAGLAKYREAVTASRATLSKRGFDEKTLKRQEAIFANSLALIDRVLAAKKSDGADLAAYTTAMAPLVLQNAYDAAKVQLEGLNAAFGEWINTLTAEERAAYHIVVSGSHQAREKNAQMAYCRALLGENEGLEQRLIFGESAFDETSCRNLLGTHLLDGAASKAFFDDPLRLQYDLLGDAAGEIVPKLKLPK
ncbi:hypothetical protein PLCT1_02128 [Planctomycetaceae bacterium]|nr:hypothetical protein PLCT1_02128 [Planctomycetaceae bacterium]